MAVHGGGALPSITPVAQSAVAASHTGSTAETTVYSVTIPGGTLGPNDQLFIKPLFGGSGTAGTKTFKMKIGAVVIANWGVGATTLSLSGLYSLANRGAVNSQVMQNTGTAGGIGTSTGGVVTSAIDFAVDQTLTVTVTLANAADTGSLESNAIWVQRAPGG